MTFISLSHTHTDIVGFICEATDSQEQLGRNARVCDKAGRVPCTHKHTRCEPLLMGAPVSGFACVGLVQRRADGALVSGFGVRYFRGVRAG